MKTCIVSQQEKQMWENTQSDPKECWQVEPAALVFREVEPEAHHAPVLEVEDNVEQQHPVACAPVSYIQKTKHQHIATYKVETLLLAPVLVEFGLLTNKPCGHQQIVSTNNDKHHPVEKGSKHAKGNHSGANLTSPRQEAEHSAGDTQVLFVIVGEAQSLLVGHHYPGQTGP